jgi:hypothetical protein
MGARQKLNQAFATGSVIVASVIGLLAQSWGVFFVSLLVLVAGNLYLGEIRPRRGDRR